MNSRQYFKLLASLVIFFLLVPIYSASAEKLVLNTKTVDYLPLTSTPVQVKRVSVASDGTQGNDSSGVFGNYVSGNGRFVAFGSLASNLIGGDSNNDGDVFVHDIFTGQTELVSVSSDGFQGNGFSGNSIAITKDGRFIAFSSHATNLVSTDTNGYHDVFVRDRQTNLTQLVSIASDGTQGNNSSGYSFVSISSDGRYVAYDSSASNLGA